MKISYYPGCTLKNKAKNLEDTALAALDALGVEYDELERWNCCGAVSSLTDDDLIHQVAPVRDLIRVKEQGLSKVMTLCSMCYNTLARANLLIKEDPEKKKTLNDFMDEEIDYEGEVDVVHFLDFLRDDVGWDKVKAAVKKPLDGLKIAPYYGCTLLRPREVAIESTDAPTALPDLLRALGAEVVDFSASAECCGSYQILGNPEDALACVASIVDSAGQGGADIIALSCPLCEYNIGKRQPDALKLKEGLKEVPTLYFTQLLALALGLDAEAGLNTEAAKSLLQAKKLVA